MPWYEEDYNPWTVWLSKPSAGRFAHPNAPLGGSGYGPGRVPPGGTEDPCWTWGVPHPNSPAGRFVTGQDAASGYLTFEFEKACQRVTNANAWEKLRLVAERALGPQTFGLGVCYGFVKNPVVSVGQLLELQKTFIEADLYDQLTRQSPWRKRLLFGSTFSSPGAMLLITALIKADKMSVGDLKRAYETREALLKEIGEIFDHPGEFLETLKDETKAGYRAKWIRFKTLQQKTDLSSQFEAGEIFGDILMDLVMLILTVVSVVGAARQVAAQAARLTARLPQLARIAEYFRGIRAAEAGAAAEEGAQAAKGGAVTKTSNLTTSASKSTSSVTANNDAATANKVAVARIRQDQMLKDNVGYNISPTAWDEYPSIGRNGSFLSDEQSITNALGNIEGKSEMTITKAQAAKIEAGAGLEPGSLQEGFKVRKVTGISDAAPRSPLEGNKYFQGPGNHLPSGAPEVVVDSISTTDNAFTTTILNVKVIP